MVLATGGRSYGRSAEHESAEDAAKAHAERAHFARTFPTTGADMVVVGDAMGADALARRWARGRAIELRVFEAAWAEEGRAAGPKRNQRMVDFVVSKLREGWAALVIGYPGGRGTADCLRRAKAAGLSIWLP